MTLFFALEGCNSSSTRFDYGLTAYNRDDFATALHIWHPLAVHGHLRAQTEFGFMYYFGQGVVRDCTQAATWFRKAAAQGDAIAENCLGLMLHDGEGTRQDYPQAVAWYPKAASQGLAEAEDNLGRLYAHGKGVPQDYDQADVWFYLATTHSSAVENEYRGQNTCGRDNLAAKIADSPMLDLALVAKEWQRK